MSDHTIRRISGVLETKFQNAIDMSDWASRPATERQTAFLSRGLAALAVNRLAGVDLTSAGLAVTDGGDDGSLDAIFFDQLTDTIFFVQSKWSKDGGRTIDLGSASKFVDGIRKILNDDFSGFNKKVRAKEAELRSVLYSGIDVRFRIILIHTGEQDIAFQVKQRVLDYVNELNIPVKLADVEFYNQKETYELIVSEHSSPSITLQISLREFGFLAKPYLAYYGRVHILEIAQWWREHKNNICSRNLRQLIQRSDINDALLHTIANEPHSFWYLNNGITIICNSAPRSPLNLDNTHIGIFTCDGVSVVNGAQTVGMIGEAIGDQDPIGIEAAGRFADCWVHVRIIPLDGCPAEFDRRITESTNFQNSVERRDFAAMDANQHRIATEFALDRKQYAYRSGEEQPHNGGGCTITEATQALACAHSMDLAVQAKREISQLWADTTKPPYIDLFNDRTTAIQVWKAVVIMRAVEGYLTEVRLLGDKRNSVVATHLNRAILNLVFSEPNLRSWKADSIDANTLPEFAKDAAHKMFIKVIDYIKEKHDGEYLASLSKNRDKCAAMKLGILTPDGQGRLFNDNPR